MRRPATVVLAFALGLATPTAQTPAPASRAEDRGALLLNRAEEHDLSGLAAHRWVVAAQSGQFVRLIVDNKEVDVVVRVLTPGGAQHREVRQGGYSGTQIVRWIADVPGNWTVHVASIGEGASGKYRILMTAQAEAGERERALIRADDMLERAAKLSAEGKFDEVQRVLEQTIQLAEEGAGAGSMDVAGLLHDTAEVYHSAGRYDLAARSIERALPIEERETGPDSLNVSTSLNNLGYMFQRLGRYRDAEPRLQRAYQIRVKHLGPDHQRLGITLDNLAMLYISLGRYADAEQCARQALGIFERSLGADHYYVSYPLNILANIAQRQRQYAEAEPLLRRALAIDEARLSTSHPNFAVSLNRLAINQDYLGHRAEARELYERAAAITAKAWGADHPSVAEILWNLANHHVENRDHAAGRRLYEQVLSIERARLGPRHPLVAGTLVGLARIDFEASPPRLADATAKVDEAISILDDVPGHLETKVSAYALRAQLRRRAGERGPAMADLAEAIRIIEELRPLLGGAEDTRARVFGHYARYYDRMIAWQIDAGDLDRAFEHAERVRARALLDQLAAGQVDLRASIPLELRAELETRENAALAEVAALQHRLSRIRSEREASGGQRAKAIGDVEALLRQAERSYAQTYAHIRSASPLWRDQITVGGRFVTLATVQRELVSAGGVMLMYQIGHDISHVFVIPPHGELPRALPLRVDREQAGVLGIAEGDLTAAALAAVINGAGAAEGTGVVDALASSASRGVRADQAGLPAAKLHALWHVLVPEPVRQRVLAASEAVIVPDGSLHQLPFETLVTVAGADPVQTVYWLDQGPVTRYAPSATVLYNLGRRPQSSVLARASRPSVLTLSDPIYDVADVIRTLGTTESAHSRPRAAAAVSGVTRNSYERLGGSLARLPGTALETEAIKRAFGTEAASAVEVLQGAGANEPALRRALSGKRYLHLATHALVGGGRESLFASLVLTPPPSDPDDASVDGFLQLHEIYALKLPEVELAVLSACDTNRGPHLEGEGVFALSRGFVAAGARRVIASHWAVDDASTAALMGAMFEQVVAEQRAGRAIPFAKALHEAKRRVRRQTQWASPYHWAPFVLMGTQ